MKNIICRISFLLAVMLACSNILSGFHNRSFQQVNKTTDSFLTAGNKHVTKGRLLQESNSKCGEWGDWRDCSKTCGIGVKARSRLPLTPENADACSQITDSSLCLVDTCPKVVNTKDAEEKKSKRVTYTTLIIVISIVNLILFLTSAIVSAKKKFI